MTENNLHPENQAPAPKKGGKKFILIAVIAVVVIAAVLIAVFASASSPLALVVKGAGNTMDAMMENNTVTLFTDLMAHGSIDVTADLAPLTESALGYGMDGQAKLSLFLSDKRALALSADVTLGATPLLDAVVVMDEQDIAIASQSLLGEKAYGVDLEKLPETFDSSVFGPNGAYSLGMTTEEVMLLVDSTKPSEELPAEAEKIIRDFFTAMMASLEKNSEISKAKSSLTLAGESCKTTAVTIAMDADALCNIAEDFLTYLDTNEELRAFLYERAAEVAAAQGIPDGRETVDQLYAGVSEALAGMDELRADAKEVNLALSVAFHITDSGNYLVAEVVELSIDEGSYIIETVAGPDPRNPREIATRMTSDFSSFDITYTVSTNDKDSYSGHLNVSEDDMHLISGSINWNKGTGALLVELSAEGETITCTGTLTHSKEAETFTILSVNGGYEEIPLGFTVTLNRSARFPEIPAYTDLLTMSESEIEGLLNELSYAAMGLLFAMG